MWDDLDKKTTVAQLGRAAAAFSPGGFRGNRVQLPTDAVAGAKAKIRAAYRRLGVATEDIPKWVREAMMRQRIGESCEIAIEEGTAEGSAEGSVPGRSVKPGCSAGERRR